MGLIKIKKVRKKFKGYNTPHQCHRNAYYYCYDNDDCKFVVGSIMGGAIAHCIVQLPNGDYIDPTLNKEQDFYIEEVYTFDEIMKLFSSEGMFFIPTQWTMDKKGDFFKYNKMERITVEKPTK